MSEPRICITCGSEFHHAVEQLTTDLAKARSERDAERMLRVGLARDNASLASDVALLRGDVESARKVIAEIDQTADAEVTQLRAEVARLRKVTGSECPVCGTLLRLHKLIVPLADQSEERYVGPRGSCITVADLIANHPAVAREMGVTNE